MLANKEQVYRPTAKGILCFEIHHDLNQMLLEQKQTLCEVLDRAREAILKGKNETASQELSDLVCLLGFNASGRKE